jgi:diketogulonate reductase-like aldo/keto reductase
MLTFTLNNGLEIPAIGSGTNTFGKENRDYMGTINNDTSEIDIAIKLGYRHFDTAISYRNEAVVALGIKNSGVERSEFYITSKIPGTPEFTKNEDAVEAGISSSLKALDTDYIDLYLIHHPWDNLDEILKVWNVLEKYVYNGSLMSIGVSNFNEKQLGFLLEHASVKPVVNQIESHPGKWNDTIVEYSLSHNVIPVAWGPLSRVSDEAKAALTKIGQRTGKSWAQVALRYQLDRGVIIIPKSHNYERQKANIELEDFSLTNEEKSIISKL